MSVSEVFAAESLDELTVVDIVLHFLREGHEDIVLLSLLQLHLHGHVLRLVAVDLFDDLLGVLADEGLIEPLTVLARERVPVSPEAEALFIAGLEDFELGDGCMVDRKNVFVVLVLLDLVAVLIELLLDLRKLEKGLGTTNFWFGEYLVIKGVDLLADEALLLFDLAGQ